MRLIDADELRVAIQEGIERAGKLIVEHPVDKLDQVANDTANSWIHAYKEVIKKIESCESMSDTDSVYRWIPCGERLPEKPVIGEDGYLIQVSRVAQPFSAYWDGFQWIDAEDKVLCPIAWMPLPEPYREAD